MKTMLKAIAIFLSVLTFIGVMSVATPVIAANIQEYENLIETIERLGNKSDKNDFANELVDERDKYTKVFQNNSGTKTAIVSAEPIHYKTQNGWEDIDNTLIEHTENAGNVYVNKQNRFTTTIPKEISKDKNIKIEKDGYTLSFSLIDSKKISTEKKD